MPLNEFMFVLVLMILQFSSSFFFFFNQILLKSRPSSVRLDARPFKNANSIHTATFLHRFCSEPLSLRCFFFTLSKQHWAKIKLHASLSPGFIKVRVLSSAHPADRPTQLIRRWSHLMLRQVRLLARLENQSVGLSKKIINK